MNEIARQQHGARRAFAAKLDIDGTPAFVVADRVVPGAVDGAAIGGLLAEARDKR